MVESAQDLIGVFLGLVVLWFLAGALIKQECLWEQRPAGRHAPAAGPRRSRLPGK